MRRVVQIVDSIEYVRSNCYQRQLLDGLERACAGGLVTIPVGVLGSAEAQKLLPTADRIVSCMRQRTLDQRRNEVSRAIGDRLLVVYDQDPWEAFRQGSSCVGAYSRICAALNVDRFAVTTMSWVPRLQRLGFKSSFVPMGILPGVCSNSPTPAERPTLVGFVGAMHPYRVALFERLERAGIHVDLVPGGLTHDAYLAALSRIAVFVHRETLTFDVAGEQVDLAEGLWVKDIEAMGRGCISVRNHDDHADEHMPRDAMTRNLRMYRDLDHAVEVVKIAVNDIARRDHAMETSECVNLIRDDDAWFKAAVCLVA